MSQFIDRRQSGKNKSAINRQRFITRFKNQIKTAINETINKRHIADIFKGEKIFIPKDDIHEPTFGYGPGGKRELILPGNKSFIVGDKIPRPETSGGQAGGEQASDQGEGLDDFSFELSKEEFIELFFEDLALPDLIKTKLSKEPTIETVRAGFSTVGTPPNIHLLRSFRNAFARKITFKKAYDNKIIQLKKNLTSAKKSTNAAEDKEKVKKEIELYQQKKKKIPFIDSFDIRYMTRAKRPKLTSQAVMFCIMDVSGSMDEMKKLIAKKFFILLYLFLTKTYQKIKIVFIRHHTTAKEVDEEEFFYSRETGGTVVSSALEILHDTIISRYPTEDWNIYVAQASDGDNWNADSPKCQELLVKDIMPYVQYYAYVEILPRHHQSLWRSYLAVKEKYKNFAMRNINETEDIYPVFRDLFKRKVS